MLYFIGLCSARSQDINFLKARAFEEQMHYDSAFYYYSNIIEKKPQDWNTLVNRGELYAKSGKIHEAISDYIQAEKMKKGVASFQLAKMYAKLKDTSNTIFHLENHLNSAYKLPASEIRLEPAFTFLEKTEPWKKLWQKNWYNKLDEQVGEAEYLTKAGDWMGVINFTNELSKNGNLRSDLLFLRAKAYFMMDNHDMAITDLNKLLENNKRNPFYFEFRANVFITKKNYKAAEADLSKAISLKPDQFSFYKKRASCFYYLNQLEAGLEDISLVLSLFPADKEALELSVMLNSKSHMHIKALSGINQLIAKDSLNARFFLLRASIYENAGMEFQAERDYDHCIKLAPSYTEAYLGRGKYFLNTNNRSSACKDLKKAEKAGNMEAGRLVFENCK